MKLSKCSRCGCFFMADSDVCPNCKPKDICEINNLKNYLVDCSPDSSLNKMSYETGITEKNLHRFFNSNAVTKDSISDLPYNKNLNL